MASTPTKTPDFLSILVTVIIIAALLPLLLPLFLLLLLQVLIKGNVLLPILTRASYLTFVGRHRWFMIGLVSGGIVAWALLGTRFPLTLALVLIVFYCIMSVPAWIILTVADVKLDELNQQTTPATNTDHQTPDSTTPPWQHAVPEHHTTHFQRWRADHPNVDPWFYPGNPDRF